MLGRGQGASGDSPWGTRGRYKGFKGSLQDTTECLWDIGDCPWASGIGLWGILAGCEALGRVHGAGRDWISGVVEVAHRTLGWGDTPSAIGDCVYGPEASSRGMKVGPQPRGTRPAALQGDSEHWGSWTVTGGTGAGISGQRGQARLCFWVLQPAPTRKWTRTRGSEWDLGLVIDECLGVCC